MEKAKLEQERATIVSIEKLGSNWLQPLTDRWKDLMAKLRLWELVQYDRILFLNADKYLLKPLDGAFDDWAAKPRKSLQKSAALQLDEPYLPKRPLCIEP